MRSPRRLTRRVVALAAFEAPLHEQAAREPPGGPVGRAAHSRWPAVGQAHIGSHAVSGPWPAVNTPGTALWTI
jgi:hypothetical protein